MRAIDADALIEGYKHMGYDATEHPEESYMEGWCKGFNSATDHCMHHVIHAPTIEPERKKGKWTKAYDGNDDHVKCTGCFKTYDWISQAQYYNYCPNCGADLRGEQNETN